MARSAPRRILVIVQRSNGDVFLSTPLIERLRQAYPDASIDLLVNSDTLPIARTLPHIDAIHTFTYGEARRTGETLRLTRKLFRRYDLSISLTASDRSVLFALAASRNAISAVESDPLKSWWKRLFLSHSYAFDTSRHSILNNTAPLGLLGLDGGGITVSAYHSAAAAERVAKLLAAEGIGEYLVFHPGAQYDYKVYPEALRHELLARLDQLGIAVVVTGSPGALDMQIKQVLPKLTNLHDWIGKTTMDELVALSAHSLAYIGADTLNMHIAAAQDRRVFAIFGPTLPSMWSPWCNALQRATSESRPVQHYGNITLFQADMACVPCGKAGCDDEHGRSDCLYRIDPETIYEEIATWLRRLR